MFTDTVALVVLFTQLCLAFFGILFFLSGLDDLFIDCCYLVWRCYSRLRNTAQEAFSSPELSETTEQPTAIMIPAWDESAVIRPMLANTLKTLDYKNYHIFIGTYPNDQATRDEVETITAEFPAVHQIVCANPGPTCKADCLNWVYHGLCLFEKEHAIRFSIFLIQDCEDMVHPLCLKLFNRLIPEY